MLEAFYSFANAALEIEPKEKFDRQSKNHSARENYFALARLSARQHLRFFYKKRGMIA